MGTVAATWAQAAKLLGINLDQRTGSGSFIAADQPAGGSV
jgi:hypothetical protein